MLLADYYFADPRVVLVPVEHLSPGEGMSRAFAALVAARRGWSEARIDLFNTAFVHYWRRSTALAARTSTWPAPRVRHAAIAADPLAVRPYVQLLNTGAWLLYDSDFDPARSHPELACYLFVYGDWMAETGEVTEVAVRSAAYWLDRTEDERRAFREAATRSDRPDASGIRAVADATNWLRQLGHETLRPPVPAAGHRPIPGTGLLVPRHLEAEPPALVARVAEGAREALARYRRAFTSPSTGALTEVCAWLMRHVPPLLVTGESERVLWDPVHPERLGAVRGVLKRADATAVQRIHGDLEIVAQRTRRFLAMVDPEALAPPDANAEQRGYAYMHRARGQIAYNLVEPGLERLTATDLPYARAMLGARTLHEWAHRAVDGGCVPTTVGQAEIATRMACVAQELDAAIAASPSAIQRLTAPDLATLPPASSPGAGLARVLATRLPDYQANLLARLLMTLEERETYVRQNIRVLDREYAPPQRWRMLIRYVFEYQYLRLSDVPGRRTFFLRATRFDRDFIDNAILTEESFDRLAAAVGRLCDAFAVDATRVRVSAPE